jgi:hypothetical protein
MRIRSLRALLANLVLVGLIVLGFGLDWQAMLWGDGQPYSPAPPANEHVQLQHLP